MKNRQNKGDFILISPIHVANNFIRRGKQDNVNITPLKLQKLLYFMYLEYIKRTGEELFREQFETWTLGPVLPSIYAEFSVYGGNPIRTYASDSVGNVLVVSETGIFKECFEAVWKKYKRISAGKMSDLTHRQGTAWYMAKAHKCRYLDKKDIINEAEHFA